MSQVVALATFLLLASPAFAWNALGHKVVCKIAWDSIDSETQDEIVAAIRRHPRYDQDFAKDLPATDNAELIFLHAGTWPDIARGIRGPDREKFDHPIWHYVNFPVTIGEYPAPKTNTSTDPADNKSVAWNVSQATKVSLAAIHGDAPPQQKAVAYCWLFHLVGDMHQPLHSVALFSERFPRGDRGGNSIRLVRGDNLHSLWDNLLGRSHKLNDVKRAVAELRSRSELWEIDTTGSVDDWIAESRELAESFVYCPEVIEAVEQPGEFQPVLLSDDYLREAGDHARARIVAAGLRLGALLGGDRVAVEGPEVDESVFAGTPPESESRNPVPESAVAPVNTGYWLNLNSNVRHNSSCRNYEGTKNGRHCTADEGKPCGICGG